MRFAHVSGLVLSCVLAGDRVAAQSQPATVPTIVAEAMALERPMFGLPKFFDGRLPTNWPAELVPAGAKVLGGGVFEDPGNFSIQTAVFAFTGAECGPGDSTVIGEVDAGNHPSYSTVYTIEGPTPTI